MHLSKSEHWDKFLLVQSSSSTTNLSSPLTTAEALAPTACTISRAVKNRHYHFAGHFIITELMFLENLNYMWYLELLEIQNFQEDSFCQTQCFIFFKCFIKICNVKLFPNKKYFLFKIIEQNILTQ